MCFHLIAAWIIVMGFRAHQKSDYSIGQGRQNEKEKARKEILLTNYSYMRCKIFRSLAVFVHKHVLRIFYAHIHQSASTK